MLKRFDIVRVVRKSDTNFNKRGVVVSILKSSNYPYRVCFGVDRFDNGIIGIYFESDLELIKDGLKQKDINKFLELINRGYNGK